MQSARDCTQNGTLPHRCQMTRLMCEAPILKDSQVLTWLLCRPARLQVPTIWQPPVLLMYENPLHADDGDEIFFSPLSSLLFSHWINQGVIASKAW